MAKSLSASLAGALLALPCSHPVFKGRPATSALSAIPTLIILKVAVDHVKEYMYRATLDLTNVPLPCDQNNAVNTNAMLSIWQKSQSATTLKSSSRMKLVFKSETFKVCSSEAPGMTAVVGTDFEMTHFKGLAKVYVELSYLGVKYGKLVTVKAGNPFIGVESEEAVFGFETLVQEPQPIMQEKFATESLIDPINLMPPHFFNPPPPTNLTKPADPEPELIKVIMETEAGDVEIPVPALLIDDDPVAPTPEDVDQVIDEGNDSIENPIFDENDSIEIEPPIEGANDTVEHPIDDGNDNIEPSIDDPTGTIEIEHPIDDGNNINDNQITESEPVNPIQVNETIYLDPIVLNDTVPLLVVINDTTSLDPIVLNDTVPLVVLNDTTLSDPVEQNDTSIDPPTNVNDTQAEDPEGEEYVILPNPRIAENPPNNDTETTESDEVRVKIDLGVVSVDNEDDGNAMVDWETDHVVIPALFIATCIAIILAGLIIGKQ